MTASAEENVLGCFLSSVVPTLDDLQKLSDEAQSRNCDSKTVSNLEFIINGEVVSEKWLTGPPRYLIGEYLEIKLQEDLRVCNRYYSVDLWIAIEMPNGTRLFMVEGFPQFEYKPAPFKKNLQFGRNAHSVFSFEIPPGMGGDYHFYAAYTQEGKNFEDFLFTLRSNRASAKILLPNN